MKDINYSIERLVQYGIRKKLIDKLDKIESTNRILEILNLDEFEVTNEDIEKIAKEDALLENVNEILKEILDFVAKADKIEVLKENTVTHRDLLDSKLMGAITPSTSEIVRKFEKLKKSSLEEATNYYYELSKSTNYIRTDRIEKNMHWYSKTEYGDIEITINLSKPEKDPKEIAAQKKEKASGYPKCVLCKENVGYRGRLNHPARQNHRALPLTLQNKDWYLQYSPYVYYNEHSIIFSGNHEPMSITPSTFDKLLEFVAVFPHYFCGSNADLPIVGGSILSHDHFQGGKHEFPMEKAEIETKIKIKGFEDIECGIVRWPMSVLRIKSKDKKKLSELARIVLEKWKNYSDSKAEIIATTGNEPHNTITPIARRRGNEFELDLVLRNNRTNEKYPMGIFHPHEKVHHIKKENIGLIEVMGLAVLPGRLKNEMNSLKEILLKDNWQKEIKKDLNLEKHLDWCVEMSKEYDFNKENIKEILKLEIGRKFSKVLEDAGVFKRTEEGKKSFENFLKTL